MENENHKSLSKIGNMTEDSRQIADKTSTS